MDVGVAWDEFDTAAAQVAAAGSAADLFGPRVAGRSDLRAATAEFRRLARLCHPDRQPPDRRAAAEAAFARLGRLWHDWNTGGQSFLLTTRDHRWAGGDRVASDEVCDMYAATDHDRGGSAWVKIPRLPGDSDLVGNEAALLLRLAAEVPVRWQPYFPRLVEVFRHRDGAGEERRISVVEPLEGFVTLAEVAQAHPGGLDPRDAAWMWRRLLVALGAAHRAGAVHGAVVPDHVHIHPGDHGLVLAGWYFAVDEGGLVPALVGRYRSWYPPEVPARRPATPATDLYLAARLLAHLVGTSLPRPLRAFVAGCTLPDPARRPADAWRLLAEFDEVVERLWGPRRFRPFHLPNRP
ncbi:MAG TPA: hypothetical protein VFJ85_05855 [Acidimicrobiales bacterium]|nr:hypothetical protein [Acidimicrobiales bacterium]